MEIRLITFLIALIATILIWIFERKRYRIIPATVYFVMIMGFDLLITLQDSGIVVYEITSLNFISRVIRLVGIITLTAYILIERRK